MIEITCPSCSAQYKVPDESIGPGGRMVTCSNCSHKWRAYPPGARGVAGEAQEPAPAPSADDARRDERVAREDRPAGEDRLAGEGGRDEQMEAIRRMLEELKQSAEDIPPEPDEAPPVSEGPSPTVRVREEEAIDEDELEVSDPLKDRIRNLSRRERQLKGETSVSDYDAEKLRKRHERRVKRLQRARERRKRSGAFLTGMTLVVGVAAVMTGLYVLHPQIAARSPQMAPALNEYVATVDRFRVQLDEATAEWRGWLEERIGRLTGRAQGGGEQQG